MGLSMQDLAMQRMQTTPHSPPPTNPTTALAHLLLHLLLLLVCSRPLLPQHLDLLLQRSRRLAVSCLQLSRHLSLCRGGRAGTGGCEGSCCACLGGAQLQLGGFQLG